MSSKYLNDETVGKILAADSSELDPVSDESDVRRATHEHQSEFPYNRSSEAEVTRREFCNFLFLTSSALFVASTGFAAKLAINAGKEKLFTPMKIEGSAGLSPGSAVNFRYPTEGDTAILVRAADGKYYAYDQKCTHLTCPVYYSKTNDRFECPCHEGGFDVKTGNVLYGPPPRPLAKISVEERNGEVWATGMINANENGIS